MSESFLNGRVELYCGDCRQVLATLPENSIDSCCTDAPYHLTSIVKRFGKEGSAPAQFGGDGRYARASAGFMGKAWDGGDIAFRPETWAEVYRILKPGAYIVAFSSCRTYHRMACAIEDAGFITHPLIGWITGQGFPKAHSVSKHIDRIAGKLGPRGKRFNAAGGVDRSNGGDLFRSDHPDYRPYNPATDTAREWDGWYYGTQSLKPAIEPIYVGQKPFEQGLNGTQNILKWGTGAINVDGCRISTDESTRREVNTAIKGGRFSAGGTAVDGTWGGSDTGRWPANLIHDGSAEVVEAFPETSASPPIGAMGGGSNKHSIYGNFAGVPNENGFGDSGSAARFFYCAKGDSDDRLGSNHPTVKPLDLMQYLIRLVTPKNGVCLDCFAGTGTTGEAAWREGMRAILIEAEPEYQADIRRRMKLADTAGPGERQWESAKARHAGKPRNDGPLFGGKD